jgi:hypothetical protein
MNPCPVGETLSPLNTLPDMLARRRSPRVDPPEFGADGIPKVL